MKYYLLDRGDETSQELAESFHRLAAERGFREDHDNPDIVISIGGDGTMLHAFHQFSDTSERIAFVGVHTGHLGFYADWKPDELEHMVDLMAESGANLQDKIVEYPLLKIELTTTEGLKTYLALNEFTLKGAEATLVARLTINDAPFEMFRGDGICVSTPSGSTAYNKSLNGALIHPSLETIQIAEIASINNRVYRTVGSSLILPRHHHCDIIPNQGQQLLMTIDHVAVPCSSILNVRTMVAEQKVKFARYRPFPFWNRVREAFVGEET